MRTSITNLRILVADLVERGDRVVITHGNGPQVGNALIRVETASLTWPV